MLEFSDYIVYVDESGDHSLTSIDPNYPLFVLAFCIFHKRHYADVVVPSLQKLKFEYFGHDLVILHEHEIRKEKPPFNIFKSKEEKFTFLDKLTHIVESSHFILTAVVIKKHSLFSRYATPDNPYYLALQFGLERVYKFLEEKQQHQKLTHVVVECRGAKEDKDLELEFRRICDGQNWMQKPLLFEIQFGDKKVNSAGLQLADLVARPIGVSILRPDQANRAFDVLKQKFYCKYGREKAGKAYDGFGLKCFP